MFKNSGNYAFVCVYVSVRVEVRQARPDAIMENCSFRNV